MDRCKELQDKANELEARYEDLSAAARAEAQEVRRGLRIEGLDDKELRVGQARTDAEASFAEQSKKINDQFESARTDALSQVDALAQEIKAKVLGA
jgi:F0F1-type ATP synthase membrane subunit b/b'